MATATQLASFTSNAVFPLLATTATAVGNHCNQGTNNTQCTMWWTSQGASGPATLGVGQQISAANVFNANLMKFMTSSSVATATDGGSSVGNPNAGSSASDQVTTYEIPVSVPLRFLLVCVGNQLTLIGLRLQRQEIGHWRVYLPPYSVLEDVVLPPGLPCNPHIRFNSVLRYPIRP